MDNKKLSKLGKKAKETAESSAGTGALFKEELPRKVTVGDVWKNDNLFAPQHGTKLESAAEADSLMGRLAKRMAARDMIDEVNLGPKGSAKGVKEAQVADTADMSKASKDDKFKNDPSKKKVIEPNVLGTDPKLLNVSDDAFDHIPSKMNVGFGLHEQTHDIKANNSSDPIQRTMQNPGSTMRQQALTTAKNDVKLKGGEIPDHNFNQEQLNKGIKVEKEHTNDLSLAKQIAKGHLIEDPDYYSKLHNAGL